MITATKSNKTGFCMNMKIYSIQRSKSIKVWRHTGKSTVKKGVTAFCVYFSKRLRRNISRIEKKQVTRVAIDGRYVYELYPDNNRTETQKLLDATSYAWEEHLSPVRTAQSNVWLKGLKSQTYSTTWKRSDGRQYECFELTWSDRKSVTFIIGSIRLISMNEYFEFTTNLQ